VIIDGVKVGVANLRGEDAPPVELMTITLQFPHHKSGHSKTGDMMNAFSVEHGWHHAGPGESKPTPADHRLKPAVRGFLVGDLLVSNAITTELRMSPHGVPIRVQSLRGATGTKEIVVNLGETAGADELAVMGKLLEINESAEKWDFTETEGGVTLGEVMGDCLSVNATVTELLLSHCSIGKSGGSGLQAIASALTENTSLLRVNLAFNCYGTQSVGVEEDEMSNAEYLSNSLIVNQHLLHLDLRGNSLGDSGVKHLANWLKTAAVIQQLDLRSNGVGVPGGSAIAKAMYACTTMQTLNGMSVKDMKKANVLHLRAAPVRHSASIKHALLECGGVAMMTGLLKTYPGTIHTVTIQHNEVKDGGAEHLGNFIATDPNCKVQFMMHDFWSITDKTTQLKVTRCKEISHSTAVLLGSILLKNTVLTSLNVQKVAVDTHCKAIIGNSLLDSKCSMVSYFSSDDWILDAAMTELDLSNEKLCHEDVVLICGVLKANPSVTSLKYVENCTLPALKRLTLKDSPFVFCAVCPGTKLEIQSWFRFANCLSKVVS
jgi:hypothetical protein